MTTSTTELLLCFTVNTDCFLCSVTAIVKVAPAKLHFINHESKCKGAIYQVPSVHGLPTELALCEVAVSRVHVQVMVFGKLGTSVSRSRVAKTARL